MFCRKTQLAISFMWNAIKGLGGIMFDGKSLVDALERIYCNCNFYDS